MSDSALASMEAELLGKIIRLLDDLEEKARQLQKAVERGLPFLPPPIQTEVSTGWQKFCDGIADWWTFWRQVAANPGSPSRVRDMGDTWTDRVGGPVSGQVQPVDGGQLTVDDNWEGDAAEAYRNLLPLQKDALAQVKATLTDTISEALNDVSIAIIVLWSSLAAALLAVVTAIAGAIAASKTFVGIPMGVYVALGGALAADVALNTAIAVIKSSADSATSKLRRKFGDDTAFGGGMWPSAVTGGPALR
jgi:hypothetical protein